MSFRRLFLVACGLSAVAAAKAEILDAAFDEFARDTLKLHNVVGASISIVDGDNISSKGYGCAILPDTAATPQTKYFTGSTTKAMVAAVAAHFVHDTKNFSSINWKTPIVDVLRNDFVLSDDWATLHTTLEDILSHRTGLPSNDEYYGQDGDTPSKVVQRLRYLPLTAEPRTLFQYCNPMFVVAQDFLQTLTGRGLESMLEDMLWKPLGMKSTTWNVSAAIESQTKDAPFARGYYWNASESNPKEGNQVPDKYLNYIPIGGAGATISTTEDYSLWIRALLSALDTSKPANASSPISNAMILDQITPRIHTGSYDHTNPAGIANQISYGLGWFVTQLLGHTIITHSGGVIGFTTQVFLVPSKNFGLVIINNAGDATAITAIAVKAVADIITPDYYPPAAREEAMASLMSIFGLKKSDFPSGNSSSAKTQHQARSNKNADPQIPLLSPFADLTGKYRNAAYGTINFTQTSDFLTAIVSDRTWPHKLTLKHKSGTSFSFEQFWPHGMHDLHSAEIAWESLGPAGRGVFEYGVDGRRIEKLGLEYEPNMVAAAARKGPEFWAEGMIRFERVGG